MSMRSGNSRKTSGIPVIRGRLPMHWQVFQRSPGARHSTFAEPTPRSSCTSAPTADHLNRKFPERLRELLKATTAEQIVEILSHARTQDPVIQMMRSMPGRVMDMLRDGEARLLEEQP